MHVGSSLPALRPKAGRVHTVPKGTKEKWREMGRDKQSSKHAFRAWSDPNKLMWMAGWPHTARLFWSG